MNGRSLRSRILLTFCLTGLSSFAVLLASLWLGFRQLGDPEALSAFVTAGVAATFGLLGLVALVWLTFDERFAKPVERLAAYLRINAEHPVDAAPDPEGARHLGDLATAAVAVCHRLKDSAGTTAARVAQETKHLNQQNAQLLRILSDIPIAVIVATNDHQIVLYDGQAADLMEREAPARLNASLFEYLDRDTLLDALAQMRAKGAKRREIAISGLSRTLYSGHVRLFGDGQGYTLMLAPLDPDAERPLTCDFGLLDRNCAEHLDDTELRDLVFVVFDCETTGLDPVKDEVVQLGAVRIVNGRIVPGERIDALVKPPIPIPAASTRVHGIRRVRRCGCSTIRRNLPDPAQVLAGRGAGGAQRAVRHGLRQALQRQPGPVRQCGSRHRASLCHGLRRLGRTYARCDLRASVHQDSAGAPPYRGR